MEASFSHTNASHLLNHPVHLLPVLRCALSGKLLKQFIEVGKIIKAALIADISYTVCGFCQQPPGLDDPVLVYKSCIGLPG